MFVQSLWELHALFSEGVYKPLNLYIRGGLFIPGGGGGGGGGVGQEIIAESAV